MLGREPVDRRQRPVHERTGRGEEALDRAVPLHEDGIDEGEELLAHRSEELRGVHAGRYEPRQKTAATTTQGVLIAPGSMFGMADGHFRIGFGRTDLPEALSGLERFAKRTLG